MYESCARHSHTLSIILQLISYAAHVLKLQLPAAAPFYFNLLQVLAEEASADAACRAQYGEPAWSATHSDVASAELRGELAKLKDGSERATAIDGRVRAKLEESRARLAALGRSRAELEASIPSATATAAAGVGALSSPPGSGAATLLRGLSSPSASELESLRAGIRSAVSELSALLEARGTAAAAIKDKLDRGAAVKELLAAASAGGACVMYACVCTYYVCSLLVPCVSTAKSDMHVTCRPLWVIFTYCVHEYCPVICSRR